jgi:hypothetical protein
MRAANFLELEEGKQHLRLNEPKRVRGISVGFSQYTYADRRISFSYLALSESIPVRKQREREREE